MTEKTIGFIENGVVIDHLPPKAVWKVVKILKIENQENGRVSLGDHYSSSKIGEKSFIKIEGRNLTDYELNSIALVAPEATISAIENGIVKNKRKAQIPEKLGNLITCPNANCISNDSAEKIKPLIEYKDNRFICHYCRNEFGIEDVKINL